MRRGLQKKREVLLCFPTRSLSHNRKYSMLCQSLAMSIITIRNRYSIMLLLVIFVSNCQLSHNCLFIITHVLSVAICLEPVSKAACGPWQLRRMADELCEQVHKWCHLTASALTKKTEAEVLSLALGLQQFCRERVDRMLKHAARHRRPVMFAYMSDGWQGKVFRRQSVIDDAGNRVTRCTRVRRHFALQRGLLKYSDGDGDIYSSMLFAEPRPLLHGARSGNFFTTFVEFYEPARLTTKGPIVEVFCFDGELFTALERLINGRRNLMYDTAEDLLIPRLSDDEHDIDVGLLSALHFQLFVKCTSHSFSNATKWGLSRWGSDELIDELYIAIQSCVSCSSDIIACLPSFIEERVQYHDADWGHDEWAARQMMWNFVVDDAQMVDTIMRVNPRWDVGAQRLLVSLWVAADPKGRDTLLVVLQYFCAWVPFTITRWATVSTAAKKWVGSLLVGLDGWITTCRANPNVSGYHLNGHQRGKNDNVRSYAVVAAFSSMVAEGAGEH